MSAVTSDTLLPPASHHWLPRQRQSTHAFNWCLLDFFLQLQFVLLIVTSMRSGDLGLFVCLTRRFSPRWHLPPSPHPDGCFSVSLGCNKGNLFVRGLWARQGQGSRGRKAQPGQPSGQLQGCASLLAADAPGHSSQAGPQHKAAARPLSCPHRVTTTSAAG